MVMRALLEAVLDLKCRNGLAAASQQTFGSSQIPGLDNDQHCVSEPKILPVWNTSTCRARGSSWKAGAHPGRENLLSGIGFKCDLAFEHVDELILS
jgi:hypothetical protein